MSLIRFEVSHKDEDSGRPAGCFMAAEQLLINQGVEQWHHEELQALLKYFDAELPEPEVMEEWEYRRAVCWFKEDAVEMIQKMWVLAGILKEYGIGVEVVRSKRPRHVLYEDDYQVVAHGREIL